MELNKNVEEPERHEQDEANARYERYVHLGERRIQAASVVDVAKWRSVCVDT